MIIEQVLEHFGGKSALARALNVKRPAVSQWVANGCFPPFRAIEIELMTAGKFKAKDLVKRGGE